MKRSDITLIAMVIGISGIVSFFISNALFASPKNRQVRVEVVESIDTSFIRPSEKFFNKDSINPTKQIKISEGQNNSPFSSPTNR